jgi:uncharacterized membrane protein
LGSFGLGWVVTLPFTEGAPFCQICDLLNFDTIAHGLVLASAGLGLFELLLPERVQKMTGACGKHTGLIRMVGVRELTTAMLAFLDVRPIFGMWSRVAGDVMDLGLLATIFNQRQSNKENTASAAAFIMGVTAFDVLTVVQLHQRQAEEKVYSSYTKSQMSGSRHGGRYRVVKSITIRRSAHDLYQFWRNFENLPQFMLHLESVRMKDDLRSHWVAKAPAGGQVEWDAEITDDRPNERISWRSTSKADVLNSGSVSFYSATGGRGTVVRVEMEYRPPAGAIGRRIAMLFGEEPAQQVGGDLRRFKNVIETGEVIRSDSVPQGTGEKSLRPAQPVSSGRVEHEPREFPEQEQEERTVREW